MQTRLPDEVVIVDGGSTDGTAEVICTWAKTSPFLLRLAVREGYSISQGRNAAIEMAQGEIIASTDAGVRLSPNWLEDLVAPIEGGSCEVASGFFLPAPQSIFEIALGATTLPTLSDIAPERFLPSSRSLAFRKEAWERVGGYPEWLDYCEDLIFDFKLRRARYRFTFVPTALAYFRPRGSVAAFFRQYYCYARGDGRANLWWLRHAIRYFTYLVLIPALFLLGLWHNPLWWSLLILGAASVLWTPYRRLWPMMRDLGLTEKGQAIFWVSIIRVVGDLAKMLGYPVGLLWRFRHRRCL